MNLSVIICPHLKGGNEGVLCGITDRLIKDMEGFTIRLCMSRRHEACCLYMQSLHDLVHGPHTVNLR